MENDTTKPQAEIPSIKSTSRIDRGVLSIAAKFFLVKKGESTIFFLYFPRRNDIIPLCGHFSHRDCLFRRIFQENAADFGKEWQFRNNMEIPSGAEIQTEAETPGIR